jgi:hypothetical protein
MLALLTNTVPPGPRPEFALAALRRVVEGAAALTGTRGEAEETTASLLDYLGRGTHVVDSA